MSTIISVDGRMVVIAIDHGMTLGALDGLERTSQLFSEVAPYTDGILVTYGSLKRHSDLLANTQAILRCDGGWSPLQLNGRELGDYQLLFNAEDAQALGAKAVVCMAIFGDERAEKSINNLAALVRTAQPYGMQVIGEVLFSRKPSFKERCHAIHITAQLGADIIKVEHPGDQDEMEKLCKVAGVPVLVLGGPKREDPAAVLYLAADAIKSGASGVAFGRNIWQRSDASAWVQGLVEIVHLNQPVGKVYERIKSGYV